MNTAGSEIISISTGSPGCLRLPLGLDTLIVFGELCVPTARVENLSALGLIVSVTGTGVAVAVAVEVAVAVRVAVAVAVLVAVAVAVFVAVAVVVLVAVAVGVAVGVPVAVAVGVGPGSEWIAMNSGAPSSVSGPLMVAIGVTLPLLPAE